LNCTTHQLVNSAISKNLPNVNLFPNDYIILCNINDTSLYLPFGNVVGINSFTALTNSGDSLTLIDINGNVLDIISYNLDWYQDPIKKDGGWSLERINPIHPCSDSSNWMASINMNGGSPGVQNSIFDASPDISPPIIESIEVVETTKIIISFNEKMNTLSILSAMYAITSGITVVNVVINSNAKGVTLEVTPPIDLSTIYTLTIFGASDCSGNSLETNNNTFALAENAVPHDLIINEILFNPFLGGVDFVEIYNNSNKFINLENWNLANLENDSISNHSVITEKNRVLLPKEFVLLTTNSNNIIEEYINSNTASFLQMEHLPNYDNKDGDVYLINNRNVVVDHFNYNEGMHFSLLNDKEGVSLERIDYDRLTNEATNWHSSSSDVGFATPGFENSQHKKTVGSNKEVTVSPKTFSPNNDGTEDVVNISYSFSKPGFVANIIIYDTEGRVIKTLVRNELLGVKGTYSWDGINQDDEKAKIGIYIIHFQVFNLDGNVKSFKKAVVLAGKFN